MNSLTKVLLEDLLDADNKKVTAIYGGGFKPPTKGHFDVVAKASEQNPEIDDILIYVGGGERDGISQGESIQIWELYKKYLPIKTIIEPVNAPVGSILRYAKEHPEEKILWIIGARENNPEDFADIASRTRTLEKYPNLQLRVIQTTGGVSGTAARNAVKDNNKEQFFHLIPDIPEKEQVWDIVSPVVTEGVVQNLKDTLKSIWSKGGKLTQDIIDGAKREGKETLKLIQLLNKMLHGDSITYDEKTFMKAQGKDLLKVLPLVAIQGIPLPIPITPLLLVLGKKFGFNILPNSHEVMPLSSLAEIVTATEIICDNCGWEWKIADGGDDLYICHKCGHDNNPDLQESKNIFKTILKDGETIYLELKYSMQERDYTSLSVIAYDSNNNKIGAAYFNSDETDKKMVISAADTSIKDTWRRKGVASSIYDLIKKQGYKIVPSKSQSDDGVKFTDKYFKQNEINPSTKLKSNIINEGRYDSISRQLASYTLKGWKDDFEHNEPTGRVEFAVGPDGDLEYEDLKFSYKGVAVFAGIQTYSYNGSAKLISGEIKITYSIPKSMLPQGWEKIYMDLISVIRHEIEHLTQGGINVKPGKEILDLPLRRLVIKYPDTLRYILLPSEKDANVQGLYLKAKKSRRPYAEVVDEYIRDVLKITNKNDVDILKGMYDKRAKELNLPAILENDPFGLNKLSRQFIKEALIETWNPKESFVSLSKYMIDNGMNIKPLPKIKIISNDEENASNLLGKTAYYNPNDKSITLYTKDRHPKDICRSFTHEMIHHEQNLEGRLNNINTTNTNEDGALPEIEKEAYEKGNMMLRNWEDSIKNV